MNDRTALLEAMNRVLDFACGELPPTATYHRRAWQWLPCEPTRYPDGREGTLLIQTTRGRRVVRTEFDWYGVQEEREVELPPGVRSFLLENELDPDPGGPFRCVVGGMVETCGCEAGAIDRTRAEPTARTSCKHRDSLAAMISEGAI